MMNKQSTTKKIQCMVSILQVYVPFKLNFIQHILFMPIIIKAIKKLLYLCFCSYRIPLVHPLANRSNVAAFSSWLECLGSWSAVLGSNGIRTSWRESYQEIERKWLYQIRMGLFGPNRPSTNWTRSGLPVPTCMQRRIHHMPCRLRAERTGAQFLLHLLVFGERAGIQTIAVELAGE